MKYKYQSFNIKTLFKFLAVGGLSTLLQYAVMFTMIYYGGIQAEISSGVGFLLSGIFNYSTNYYFTFHNYNFHKRSLPRFYISTSVGFMINEAILNLCIIFMLPIFLSQVIATFCVLTWNYIISVLWIFKVRNEDQA